jgi:hypothetical protein
VIARVAIEAGYEVRNGPPRPKPNRITASCSSHIGDTMGTTVKVITGTGGMERAIARRLGPGSTLVLADYNAEALAAPMLPPAERS